MARRMHSLHHNLQAGENVVFHREHRSKKGRKKGYSNRKRKALYEAERKFRILDRRVKKRMREFVKENRFDANMTV